MLDAKFSVNSNTGVNCPRNGTFFVTYDFNGGTHVLVTTPLPTALPFVRQAVSVRWVCSAGAGSGSWQLSHALISLAKRMVTLF